MYMKKEDGRYFLPPSFFYKFFRFPLDKREKM